MDAHPLFAYSTVATAPSPATTGLSLVVATGQGTRFGSVFPYNATVYQASATAEQIASGGEVIRITARVSDTLTIVRMQEGTAARTILVGDQIVVGPTPKTITDVEIASSIGSLQVIGHSYIAGANYGGTGTDYMEEVGMLGVLCGLLDIANENVTNLAIGGTSLHSPNSSFGATFSGWAGALQFVGPNNSSIIAAVSTSGVLPAVPRSNPGLGLIVHGVNDLSANYLEWDYSFGASLGQNAWKHALRTVISRFRAGGLWSSKSPAGTVVWDPIFTFTGTWTDTLGVQNTGPAIKKTSTNTDSVKVTLPADLLPGTYAFCFRGQQNGYTTVASMTSGAATMTVAANAEFPQSGTFVANIQAEGANTREEVLVTAGAGTNTWTITRARNGTSASAHASAIVTMASDTGLVTWTTNGSNATITGTTALGGQGFFGQQVSVVKRFVLTAADAGKTITATVSGIVASDTSFQIQFDSFWMEAPDPTPVVVANLMKFPFGAFVLTANIDTMNTATAAVVAEFDSSVVVADFYTYMNDRSGTLNGAMGVTTSIAFTANNKTVFDTLMNASPFKPFRMVNNGNGQATSEDVWVTGITYVSGNNYTLTVTRGYNGTAAQNNGTGTALCWAELMANDNLHPNPNGHAFLANQLLAAIQTLTVTPVQLAKAAGNWQQNNKVPVLDASDNNYLMPVINAIPTAAAIAVQRVTWVPVYLPKSCTIVEIGCVVTAFNAASTIAMGIYDSDGSGQRPGVKLYDCGTISGNTPNGLKTIAGLSCRHRGGWVWLAFLQTGTAATVRCVPQSGLGYPFIPQSTTALTATLDSVCGYQTTGQTTLPTSPPSDIEVTGAQSTTNAVAMVYIRVRNTQFV